MYEGFWTPLESAMTNKDQNVGSIWAVAGQVAQMCQCLFVFSKRTHQISMSDHLMAISPLVCPPNVWTFQHHVEHEAKAVFAEGCKQRATHAKESSSSGIWDSKN